MQAMWLSLLAIGVLIQPIKPQTKATTQYVQNNTRPLFFVVASIQCLNQHGGGGRPLHVPLYVEQYRVE